MGDKHAADDRAPHAEWAPPLLRWRPYRTLIALALVLVTGAAFLAGLLLLYFFPDAWQLAVVLLIVVCMPLAVRPVELGRWSANWLRWPEMAGFAVLVAIALGLAGRGLLHGGELLADRASTGAAPAEVAFWLAEGTAALAGAFLLLAAVPLPLRRRAAHAALAVLGAAAVASGLATAVVYAGPDGCGSFAVDRERWDARWSSGSDDDATERIAAAVVRCGSLDEMTASEVRAVLGKPDDGNLRRGTSTAGWEVGTINDGFGPGDGQYLDVDFLDGRVSSTSLRFDEYEAD